MCESESEREREKERRNSLTTQAFFNGTIWSMSTSLAAVHDAPSYGLSHVPEVAVQAELTTTLVPSRLSTYSLVPEMVSKEQAGYASASLLFNVPGVAGALYGVPGWEQVPVVVPVVSIRLDGERRELGFG